MVQQYISPEAKHHDARALLLAADRFSILDEHRREAEESIENAALRGQLELRSNRANAEQVLQYYVFQSNESDVNYFFDKYPKDWRVIELAPMAVASGVLAEVVLDLIVALHRLRSNTSTHLLHFSRALCNLVEVLRSDHHESKDWLRMLSCILLLAQYDVNYRRGKDLSTHLRAAATLFELHDDLPVPAALEYQKRTLTRIAMTYDLQHSLVSGDDLHLSIFMYRKMCNTSCMVESTGEGKLTLDQLWSETHLCWAEFSFATQAGKLDTAALDRICARLAAHMAMCRAHFFEVNSDHALHSWCPFGPTIVYKSPALRLIGVFNHTLVLMLCSWYTTARNWLDVLQAKTHIMCAHAPLFVHDRRGRRTRSNDKYIAQAFPALLHIMIAASEVGPEEPRCQEWIASIVQSAKEIGYTLGEALLLILQSHAPEHGRGLWRAIGCKSYIMTCRYLRQRGLA